MNINIKLEQNWLQRVWACCRKHQLKLLGGLFVLGVIAMSVSAFFTPSLWTVGEQDWDADTTRNFLLALGGWGGFFGLALTALRQETFSKQVEVGQTQADTAEKNLFNDRLSRAVESLASEQLTVRMAGIRLLENLGKAYDDESEENKLITNILVDFINECAKKTADRRDIQKNKDAIDLALDVVVSLSRNHLRLQNIDLSQIDIYSKEFNKMHFNDVTFGKIIEVQFKNCSLSNVRFTNFMREVEFVETEVDCGNFEFCNIIYAHFSGMVESVDPSQYSPDLFSFRGAQIMRTGFSSLNLRSTCLIDANLNQCDFTNLEFDNTDISGVNFNDVYGLTQEQIDKCIFENYKQPKNLPNDSQTDQPLIPPSHRRYVWKENELGQLCRRLVESGEWIESFTPWWKEEERKREREEGIE